MADHEKRRLEMEAKKKRLNALRLDKRRAKARADMKAERAAEAMDRQPRAVSVEDVVANTMSTTFPDGSSRVRKQVSLDTTVFPPINIDPEGKQQSSQLTQTDDIEEISVRKPEPKQTAPPMDAFGEEEEDEAMQRGDLEDRPKALTDTEKMKIEGTSAFRSFLKSAAKVVEEALTEEFDILVDYTMRGVGDEGAGLDEQVHHVSTFSAENITGGRSVTDLVWIPEEGQNPDLFVASYNASEEASRPEGVVCMWSMHREATDGPKWWGHCQSSVLCVTYVPWDTNLIVGGTYSGQICVWDRRVSKQTPVQRTPLSSEGHTHPVYCIAILGSDKTDHVLISISTDGRICTWSLDMLAMPQERSDLEKPSAGAFKTVAITALSLDPADRSKFLVGCESGDIFNGSLAAVKPALEGGIFGGNSGGSKLRGHMLLCTQVDIHPARGPIDFSHVFLTSGIDWSVKLWDRSAEENKKENGEPDGTFSPLISFGESLDYVYDVRWSPTHPALFVSVDGTGTLDLWNLNAVVEAPLVSTRVTDNAALNKVAWAHDGRKVATGDSLGAVHVYDLGHEVADPRPDEWPAFAATLRAVKAERD